MANSLTDLNREVWEKELQIELEKNLVALDICNPNTNVKDSDTIHKPYMSRFYGQTYTKGTNFTVQDATATDEYLSINKAECVPILIDQVDKVQNSYDARTFLTPQIITDLNRKIDANIFSDYDLATSAVDDGSIGGTSGVSAVISQSNVNRIFTAAAKKLNNLSVPVDQRFAVISPTVLEYLQLYTSGKDTQFGDDVLERGYVGRRFGFEIYVSQNLTFTARWTPANDPTATVDAITINGVTLHFVSTIGSVAGNVLCAATTTANTIDNLVTLLNAPGTTTSTGVALSQDDIRKLEGIVATDGTTYLGIEHVGGGEVAVSAVEANDPWTLNTVHCLFGRKGATDLALQVSPNIGFNQEPKLLPGSGNLVAWDMYGWKTWTRNKDMIVDVKLDSSSW